ncbi:MAG TPA: hypothetical protein VI876_09130 [Dehalococcoidia bacterium]|nr:hypothetical protein [Dehalococcoidia bacterium]
MVYGNRQHRSAQEITADIAKAIDDAAETLRWCKKHLHERKASDALRLVQLNLACIAIAIDWQMEGDLAKSEAALDRVWWAPHKDDEAVDQSPTGH